MSLPRESLDHVRADQVIGFAVRVRCACLGVANGFAVCACGNTGVLERTLTVAELRKLIGGE